MKDLRDIKDASLPKLAARIRGKVIEMSHVAKAPHLGSSLSCVDILVALYWSVLSINPEKPLDVERDRFLLSKGHAAAALYASLAFRGFFPQSLLDTYAQNDSRLAEHPGPSSVPGIEVATGSLGHGLSIGLGMAFAGRIQKNPFRIFVLLSDGECNEGSVWEAAMSASSNKLDNVTVLIDYNKWQATGRSKDVMALEPLREKWISFGWNCQEIDGHDIGAVIGALQNASRSRGKPNVIIAHTIKGKGVSFMEDDNNWHYRIPTTEEVEKAKKELGLI